MNQLKKEIDFNEDQNNVIKAINNSLDKKQFNSHLLHGVTGSGKTEIFIEAIKTVIKKIKQLFYCYQKFH